MWRISWVLGGLLLISSQVSLALGLGEIELKSYLNQPLRAEIPLLSVTPGEMEGVRVRVAPEEDFRRVGLTRRGIINAIHFKVVSDGGRDLVLLTTERIVKEPFLSFLIEARSTSGRVLREYTVLLEPPVTPGSEAQRAQAEAAERERLARQQEAARTARREQERREAETRRQQQLASQPRQSGSVYRQYSVAPTSSASRRTVTEQRAQRYSGTYGPVKAGETLWSIAFAMRPDPDRISMDQMQIAIYNANPQSFDGNINRMIKGTVLRIPSIDYIAQIDKVRARSQVRSMKQAFAASTPVAPSTTSTAVAEMPDAAATVSMTETGRPEEKQQSDSRQEQTTGQPAPATTDAEDKVSDEGIEFSVAEEGQQAEEAEEMQSTEMAGADGTGSAQQEEPAPQDEKLEELMAAADTVIEPSGAQGADQDKGGVLGRLGGLGSPLLLAGVVLVILLLVAVFLWNRKRQNEIAESGVTDYMSSAGTEGEAASGEESGEAGQEASGATDSEVEVAHLAEGEELMTEVEMHMAYGLYDECEVMLKQAIDREPDRNDLRLKLLEVYQAAGEKDKLEKEAESLKVKAGGDSEDWQQALAILAQAGTGKQEAGPGPSVAQSDQAAEATREDTESRMQTSETTPYAEESGTAGSADFAQGVGSEEPTPEKMEPEAGIFTPEPSEEHKTEDRGDKTPATEEVHVDTDEISILKRPQKDLSGSSEAEPEAANVETQAETLDFEFDELSSESEEKQDTTGATEEKSSFASEDTLDFNLDEIQADAAQDDRDTSSADTEVSPQPDINKSIPDSGPEEPVSLNDELMVDDTPGEDTLAAEEDEVSTKLDLARAYLDMGEEDMCKGLLDDVQRDGNDAQKREAAELLAKLS